MDIERRVRGWGYRDCWESIKRKRTEGAKLDTVLSILFSICYSQSHIHSICYPQNCGKTLFQRVPADTGHRQSRESVKHLSSMANHSSSASPPGSILFCSHAGLKYQNSNVLATHHYLNPLHQYALLSEGIWVAIWTFYGFFILLYLRQTATLRVRTQESPQA